MVPHPLDALLSASASPMPESGYGHLGSDPVDVAIAWLLANPVVTSPIIGPRSIAQLDGAPRALEVSMPSDVLAKLDEIFPGPGGQAPEAWAW